MQTLMKYLLYRVLCVVAGLTLCVPSSFAQKAKAKGKKSASAEQQPAQPMQAQPLMKLDTIKVNSFKPLEVVQVIEGDPKLLIIDVRSPEEYSSGHIKGAINIPVEQVEKRIPELTKEKERNIILVGGAGKDAMTACGIMVANKFQWVWYMKGGMDEWKKIGLGIEK